MAKQKVLVILDRRNRPQTALKRALRMQKDAENGIQLKLVSFLHNALVETEAAFNAKERRAVKKLLLDQHDAWLEELSRDHPDLPSITTVWAHDIAGWVQKNARRVDLVIKSSSGSKRSRSATDWALLNTCPTNLLLVGHRRVRQPKKVLAALDMDHKDKLHKALNQEVLATASELAQLSGAELHAACVVEVAPALVDLDVIDEKKAKTKVQKRTKSALDMLLRRYPKVKRHFPVGRIGQALADCAKDVGADVVVVGMRAHNIKSSLGLGSSAQRIVRKAPCDVLAVRSS